jgi:hypothetical protein
MIKKFICILFSSFLCLSSNAQYLSYSLQGSYGNFIKTYGINQRIGVGLNLSKKVGIYGSIFMSNSRSKEDIADAINKE